MKIILIETDALFKKWLTGLKSVIEFLSVSREEGIICDRILRVTVDFFVCFLILRLHMSLPGRRHCQVFVFPSKFHSFFPWLHYDNPQGISRDHRKVFRVSAQESPQCTSGVPCGVFSGVPAACFRRSHIGFSKGITACFRDPHKGPERVSRKGHIRFQVCHWPVFWAVCGRLPNSSRFGFLGRGLSTRRRQKDSSGCFRSRFRNSPEEKICGTGRVGGLLFSCLFIDRPRGTFFARQLVWDPQQVPVSRGRVDIYFLALNSS